MKAKHVYIGIFGKRNQGKSALINAIAGQDIAIVADVAGTTTDPVKKSIEIFGIGPSVLVDTAGIDDEGEIGCKRVQKTFEAAKTVDVALLVISENQFGAAETTMIQKFREYHTPFLIVQNKADMVPLSVDLKQELLSFNVPVLECSAKNHNGIDELVKAIVRITPSSAHQPDTLVGDCVKRGDLVVLVMPQDAEAPEGRLILPQVQVIRDLLDNHAVAIALQTEELSDFLQTQTPKLIITDSQVFAEVSQIVTTVEQATPGKHLPLTSFSIILSRAKGNFELFLQGTPAIENLKDGDRILMMESCTHVTSCEDIGRHKIPALLRKSTGKKLDFTFVAALEPLPHNLSEYALAIQCGGCMVTKKQLQNRVEQVRKSGVPITNYGMAIAWLTNIYTRVTEIFTNNESF